MFFRKKSKSPESMLQEAEEYFKKGEASTKLHDFSKAETWFRKCVSVLEPLKEEHGSRTIQRKLSHTYSMLSVLGLATADEKKRKEAALWAKKAVDIDEKLVEEAGTPDAYDCLATSYSNLGSATLDIMLCDKALQIWMKLQKEYPDNPLYARRVETQQYNNRQLLLKLL